MVVGFIIGPALILLGVGLLSGGIYWAYRKEKAMQQARNTIILVGHVEFKAGQLVDADWWKLNTDQICAHVLNINGRGYYIIYDVAKDQYTIDVYKQEGLDQSAMHVTPALLKKPMVRNYETVHERLRRITPS